MSKSVLDEMEDFLNPGEAEGDQSFDFSDLGLDGRVEPGATEVEFN